MFSANLFASESLAPMRPTWQALLKLLWLPVLLGMTIYAAAIWLLAGQFQQAAPPEADAPSCDE